ncbi:uncharacterized protein LOC129312571 isoform X3 [Prosopis cineraria]|uniref:uncharacterized protein LOC129312571 isoform X3 n=1 Tax=Prosopis cineraria TaxID=364024 RepID=UPI00240F3A08|nr:uncharacterized protein LOC129312571 isoform X3 [Prosopis cineraria]
MADNSGTIPPPYDLNAKWDACLDLTIRRFVYSSLSGAFGGLLFFSGEKLHIMNKGKTCQIGRESSDTLGFSSFWCWSGNWICIHRVFSSI